MPSEKFKKTKYLKLRPKQVKLQWHKILKETRRMVIAWYSYQCVAKTKLAKYTGKLAFNRKKNKNKTKKPSKIAVLDVWILQKFSLQPTMVDALAQSYIKSGGSKIQLHKTLHWSQNFTKIIISQVLKHPRPWNLAARTSMTLGIFWPHPKLKPPAEKRDISGHVILLKS